MTLEQGLLAFITLTWGGYALSFAIGKWTRKQESSADMPLYRIQQLELWRQQQESLVGQTPYRVAALERRMDQAGEKMSDLANQIQVLPDRFRDEFMSRRECNALFDRRHFDRRREDQDGE